MRWLSGSAVKRFTVTVACIALVFPASLEAQPIRFSKESLLITLADDAFSFSGLYFFDNPGPAMVRRALFYPLVRSGSLPDSVNIVTSSGGHTVPFAAESSGISFTVEVPACSTEAYRITFHQRAPGGSLEYLLTTTAEWGRPLERMTITIRAPESVSVKRVSMKPDFVRTGRIGSTMTIDRQHFMPDRNLVVEWERRKQ
jgi:hypothetical protein